MPAMACHLESLNERFDILHLLPDKADGPLHLLVELLLVLDAGHGLPHRQHHLDSCLGCQIFLHVTVVGRHLLPISIVHNGQYR